MLSRSIVITAGHCVNEASSITVRFLLLKVIFSGIPVRFFDQKKSATRVKGFLLAVGLAGSQDMKPLDKTMALTLD